MRPHSFRGRRSHRPQSAAARTNMSGWSAELRVAAEPRSARRLREVLKLDLSTARRRVTEYATARGMEVRDPAPPQAPVTPWTSRPRTRLTRADADLSFAESNSVWSNADSFLFSFLLTFNPMTALFVSSLLSVFQHSLGLG